MTEIFLFHVLPILWEHRAYIAAALAPRLNDVIWGGRVLAAVALRLILLVFGR